jgi:glucose/arabinose dehydrogenase
VAAAALALLLTGCSDGADGGADGPSDVVDAALPATAPEPIAPEPIAPEPTAPGPTAPPATPGSTPSAGASDGPGTPSAPDVAPPAPPRPGPAGADPDPASVALALTPVATLDAPIALAIRPGDPTLYIAERAGRVRPVDPDGTVGSPILDLSDDTTTTGERGLLGLAWSPAGDRLYVSSTDAQGATVLEAVDVVDGVLAQDRRLLLRVPQPASNHNGGGIAFGPDGHLWLGLGDGGGADDEFGHGQDPTTLLGAMLRLDVEGGVGQDGAPYAIPPDNPFADGRRGAPEVWAYGLRNPWRWSFDRATGDLWIADVGQGAVEEVNRVPATAAGLNYGWPRFEGDRPFDGRPAAGPVVAPLHTYDHGRGCSITGGVVYRGSAIPALQGAYLYGDFCDGRVFTLDLDPAGAVTADVDTGLSVDSLVSFGEGPDGEVYVLSLDGPVSRITPE